MWYCWCFAVWVVWVVVCCLLVGFGCFVLDCLAVVCCGYGCGYLLLLFCFALAIRVERFGLVVVVIRFVLIGLFCLF